MYVCMFVCMCIYNYIYICVCVCIYVCVYILIHIHTHTHTYTGLEIGGVESQNANHFWGNCESLWQSESQNCESLLADLQFTF